MARPKTGHNKREQIRHKAWERGKRKIKRKTWQRNEKTKREVKDKAIRKREEKQGKRNSEAKAR